MNDQELIVKLRKSHKLKQKDMADLLETTVSKYSRLEQNPEKMSLEIYRKILAILNVEPSEFETLKLENSEFTKMYELYYTSVKEIHSEKIKKLYNYVHKHRTLDQNHEMLYLRTKRIFHPNFKDIVPDLTLEEIAQYVFKWREQTYFSKSDLEILMVIGIKLIYSDYEYLIDKMVLKPLKTNTIPTTLMTQHDYKLNIIHIINNMIHTCIENTDYDNATKYLEKFKKYVNFYEASNFKPIIKYYDIIIPKKNILDANDIYDITTLIASLEASNLHSIAYPIQLELKKIIGDNTITESDTTIYI